MKKNVGSIDKVVRVILAIIAIYFAYNHPGVGTWLTYVLWLVAVIMLATAFTGTCPLFSIFGVSTCKAKDNE
jgi:hypothetical protein